MFRQRVLTAIVLLVVLGLVLAAPARWAVPMLLAVVAACALWEWLRLVWPVSRARRIGPVVVAAVAAGVMAGASWRLALAVPPIADGLVAEVLSPLAMLAGLFWLCVATTMVVQGRTQVEPRSAPLAVAGVVVTLSAWWALTQLYLQFGSWCLVSLMALVWAADIGAYFCGKAFGRHKLAPRVSPGKSIEGALGGIVAALLWTWLGSQWDGGFGQLLAQRWSLPMAALLVAGLAVLSIVGDLFESLLKRRAGVKDSSALLPGHGGVYDRIDALLPVSVLAWLLLEIA